MDRNAEKTQRSLNAIQALVVSCLVIYALFIFNASDFYTVVDEQYLIKDLYAWLQIKEIADQLPAHSTNDYRTLRLKPPICDATSPGYDIAGADTHFDPPCPYSAIVT